MSIHYPFCYCDTSLRLNSFCFQVLLCVPSTLDGVFHSCNHVTPAWIFPKTPAHIIAFLSMLPLFASLALHRVKCFILNISNEFYNFFIIRFSTVFEYSLSIFSHTFYHLFSLICLSFNTNYPPDSFTSTFMLYTYVFAHISYITCINMHVSVYIHDFVYIQKSRNNR